MHRLTFEFKQDSAGGQKTLAATAHMELTEKQFDNFFHMREVALEKNLSTVELYVHGAKWYGDAPNMEFSEFIIHSTKGVALKAFPVGAYSKVVQSHWIDWATLDLIAVLGNSLERPIPLDSEDGLFSVQSQPSLEAA